MATTAAGTQLTDQHRRRQLALRAITLRELLSLWPAFDLANIDRSWPPLEAALLTLIRARHRDSAALASSYYQAFRVAEGVSGAPDLRLAPPPPDDAMRANLRLLGPIATKRAIAANQTDVAATALTRLSGSVSRQALAGGRGTLVRSVEADRQALGWARVMSGNACAFCRMLASRGPVYKQETVGFQAHDHCACAAEPVYRRDQPWPEGSREAKQQWNEATRGLSGGEARKAFRRAVEGRV